MQAERIGLGLTAACAVHCAALPFVAGFAHFLHNPVVEYGMIGTAALIGSTTLSRATRHHRRALPLVLFAAGLLSLLSAHTLLPEQAEMTASILGAVLMFSAQLVNRRFASIPCCSAHAA